MIITGAELFDVLKTGFGVTDDKDLMITFNNGNAWTATIEGKELKSTGLFISQVNNSLFL